MNFKDWKTTIPALISAFFAFVASTSDNLHWPSLVTGLAAFVSAGGLAVFGINSNSKGGPALKCLLMLILASTVTAQVKLQAVPQPMVSIRGMAVKAVGPWEIPMCNDGPDRRVIAPERVWMAFPQVRFLSAPRSRLTISDEQSRSTLGRLLVAFRGASTGAMVGAAVAEADPRVIAITGAMQIAIPIMQRWVQGEMPSAAPYFDRLLDSPITLEPGSCYTASAFAAKMKAPKVLTATIP